jgi:D-glycero-D-manno-heptose 1,7-bisphosphate phosphatase
VAYCPHRVDEQCACRKPQPGLLVELARRHGVDLAASIIVGDAVSDLEAAAAAGCRAILVLTGRGREQLALARAAGWTRLQVAEDLRDAVGAILRQPGGLAGR